MELGRGEGALGAGDCPMESLLSVFARSASASGPLVAWGEGDWMLKLLDDWRLRVVGVLVFIVENTVFFLTAPIVERTRFSG